MPLITSRAKNGGRWGERIMKNKLKGNSTTPKPKSTQPTSPKPSPSKNCKSLIMAVVQVLALLVYR